MKNALDTCSPSVIQLTDAQKKRILHDIAQNKKFVPVPVAENLTWEEFSRINLHLPYLPGVQPDVGETRDYPFGSELVHVLGYVAAVSPARQEGRRRSAARSAGLSHRQARHRESLRRTNPRHAPASAASKSTPMAASSASWAMMPACRARMSGSPSTASCRISPIERLGDESAACVVMDADNGDVLALASTPGFDPNLFNVGITSAAMARPDHRRSQAAAEQGASPAPIRPARPSRPSWRWRRWTAGIAMPGYTSIAPAR